MPTIQSVLGSRLKRLFGNNVTVSTWTDETGTANATQGTSSRQPTMTTTPCGRAAVYFTPDKDFSGSNGDVMVATAAGASSTPDYTIIGCVLRVLPGYAVDGTGNGSGVFGIGSSRCNIYIYDPVDFKIRAAAFGASSFAEQTTGTINDGKWHRAIVHADQVGNTMTLYLDGVAQTTTASADDGLGINLGTTDIFIGGGDASAVAGLNGAVGCAFIGQDSAAFTATEIAALDKALLEQIRILNFTFAGDVGTGSSAALARFPTGVTGGDLLALAVVGKFPAAFTMPTTPTGFNIVATGGATGGAGNPGADSGSTFARWFWKVADGTESGGVTCSVPSGNAALAQMFRYTVATGYQINSNLVRGTYGSDNTAGTTFVATGVANQGYQAGDLLLVAAAPNTDARTYSNQTLIASGLGPWMTPVERSDRQSSQGLDVSIVVSEHSPETGVASGLLTFQMMASGTTSNQNAGAASFLRLRAALSYVMPLTTVSFVTSGVNATLTYGGGAPKSITAAVANFIASGPSAGLTKQSKIVAAGTTFLASGIDATLTKQSKIVAGQASFIASGPSAGLTKQSKIVAGSTTFLASGIDATLRRGTTIAAASTTFLASGIDATLTKQSKIVAGQASFIVSGVDAGLTKQSKIVAGSTTFLASGIDATLRRGATIAAASTTFLASGVAATLTKQSKIVAAQASFIVSGVDAAIAKSVYMTAAAATYVASGINATLTKQSKITAAVAPFVVSGVDAGLGVAMPAAVAPIVVSGIAAALSKQSKIVAAQASFIASGPAAGLYAGRKIVAAQASFIASGINATLTKQSKLTAAVAPIVASGINVVLGVAMPAAVAPFVVSGIAATLAKQSKIVAGQASFVASGLAVGLYAGRKIVAGQASFIASGINATLTKQSKLTAAVAPFVVSGIDAGLSNAAGASITAGIGTVSIAGQDAALKRQLNFTAAASALAITAQAAGLSKQSKIVADAGALSLVGPAVGLYAGRYLSAASSALTITGQAAGLRSTRLLTATSASLAIVAQDANLRAARIMAAAAAAYAITGQSANFANGRAIVAATGALTIVGTDVTLAGARIFTAGSASLIVSGNDATFTYLELVLSASTAALGMAFPEVNLVYGQYVPPRQMAIAIDRAVPLVRIDLAPPMPLVRIDHERPVPLVSIELGEQPMSLRVGAVAVLGIKTRILGELANPDSLYVIVTNPSGTATTYTFGTSAAVEYIPDEDDASVETGRYRARIPCTEAGTWSFVWYTGGTTVGVESGTFTVDAV